MILWLSLTYESISTYLQGIHLIWFCTLTIIFSKPSKTAKTHTYDIFAPEFFCFVSWTRSCWHVKILTCGLYLWITHWMYFTSIHKWCVLLVPSSIRSLLTACEKRNFWFSTSKSLVTHIPHLTFNPIWVCYNRRYRNSNLTKVWSGR